MDNLGFLCCLVLFGVPRAWSKLNICRDPSIDAAFTSPQKISYLFKGDHFYEFNWLGAPGEKNSPLRVRFHPFKIRSRWAIDPVPPAVSAALSVERKKHYETYIIQGHKVWMFSHSKKTSPNRFPERPVLSFSLDDGEHLKGIPANITAAYFRRGTNLGYFFRGDLYWVWNFEGSITGSPISVGKYPKSVANLGFPAAADAILRLPNGFTFVFHGQYYWKYDNHLKKVHDRIFPYPRSVGHMWFGCSQKEGDDDGNEYDFDREWSVRDAQMDTSASTIFVMDLPLFAIHTCLKMTLFIFLAEELS